MRDFAIDPMDDEVVARLKQSIEEDGFWGGIVCRKLPDGTLQIGAGHHRVAAALAAGITEADLFVAEDMDDASMIRVYARENATQRGLSSTALTGTVAAAMRYIAKGILTGSTEKFFSTFHMPTLRDRLVSERGMGREVLTAFLSDIPGINDGSVQQQLANLKSSGDYARLIAEVEKEIAAEQAAQEAQDLARQAAQEAAKHSRIFDFEGVAQRLKNPHQVDVFRGLVTHPNVRMFLPVNEQAPLAAAIVERAKLSTPPREVSGAFIREKFHVALQEARVAQRRATKEEEEELERQDGQYAMTRQLTLFRRQLDRLAQTGTTIAKLLRECPVEAPPPSIMRELRNSLKQVADMVDAFQQHQGFYHK
jgi:hypothetical protein